MLRLLREKTKVILWIVVVAFVVTIFAAWGMNYRSGTSPSDDRTADIVGRVNGIDISRTEYRNNLNNLYGQMMQQRGEGYTPSDFELYMLRNQAWELTVQEKLVAERIRKMNITVTDRELVSFIRNNPHPSLRQVFTDEAGNFNYQEYLNAISDPSRDWTELEHWARAALPRFKLENLLTAKINISERELVEEFKKENEKVKVKYVTIPFERDTSYTPTESELRTRYEEEDDNLIAMEKRGVSIVEIKIEPTPTDFDEVRESISEIKEEIADGMDFSEAAKSYSEDVNTAVNGGDLGFIEKGEMDQEFEKAAFALEPGEISDPVKTGLGYHLIKAEEKKSEDGKELLRVRHILLEVKPGYETTDSLGTFIRGLRDDIGSRGFEKAVKDAGLEVRQVPPFNKQGFIEGVGYAPVLSDFVFSNGKGSVSPPLDVGDSIYFVKITDIIPESKKPFQEVVDYLTESIRRARVESEAEEKALDIRKKALASSIEAAAGEGGFEVKETPFFGEAEPVADFRAKSVFVKACHMLPEKTLSKPIKGNEEYYLIVVTEKKEADMSKFGEDRERLASMIRNRKAMETMSEWYNDLKENAEIVDLRSKPIK